MNDVAFPLISTIVIVLAIVGWVALRVGLPPRRKLLLLGLSMAGTLAALVSIEMLIPRGLAQVIVTSAFGALLAGALLYFALRCVSLPSPHSRRLIVVAVAGLALVLLRVLVEIIDPTRPR